MEHFTANLSQNFQRVFLETTFFELARHLKCWTDSTEPIYLKFGVNVLYIFLYRLNQAQIKIFNFTIFKKFGIVKKHTKKEILFSNGRDFVKEHFFYFSKVHAIAASILIKNPFGIFASHD